MRLSNRNSENLAAPLRWRDRRLDEVAIVHLCDGVEGVGLACAQAAAGHRVEAVAAYARAIELSDTPRAFPILTEAIRELSK